jgi:hypothetical protein
LKRLFQGVRPAERDEAKKKNKRREREKEITITNMKRNGNK